MAESGLGALIDDEVKRAESDLSGFRSRALSLVGLTGVLVTFVSGLVAIAVGGRKDVLPDYGPLLLFLALVAYVAAAVFALLANQPQDVDAANADSLEGFARDNWDDEGWDREVAIMLAQYLVSLRALNNVAADRLTVAIVLEIVGMVATATLGLSIVLHVT